MTKTTTNRFYQNRAFDGAVLSIVQSIVLGICFESRFCIKGIVFMLK